MAPSSKYFTQYTGFTVQQALRLLQFLINQQIEGAFPEFKLQFT